MLKKIINCFTPAELGLWLFSVLLIVLSFAVFGAHSRLTPAASLIGVTSLIFNAKVHPAGQALMVIFSLLYGIISYSFAYYGEMLTYIGMTMPMALYSMIAWLKNPYNGNRSEVAVNYISKKEQTVMWSVAAAVTALFYFILKHFNTANLPLSTVSVTTSFPAVYLTARRSPAHGPLRTRQTMSC